MKKLLCFLVIIVTAFSLWSCTAGMQTPTCTVHVDRDGDFECDVCGAEVECANHIDDDENLRCDACKKKLECTNHKDVNANLICDRCAAKLECTHVDANNDGVCDVSVCKWNYDHEHEYELDWTYNESEHWHEPECNHDIPAAEKGPHYDMDNDSECDACGYDYGHTHTYAEEWSHDDDKHWREVTCGHNIQKGFLASHDDDNNDGICDGCSWNYDHTHTYEESWSHDAKNHWYAAACGHDVKKDVAPHADENNDGLCDGCSWNYDHEHEYASKWSKDEENHWHAPSCDHDIQNIDVAPHADEDDDGLCDVCEYVVCKNHTFNPDLWQWDETTHWRPSLCGHANAYMEAAGHSFDEDMICTHCGYYTGHEHTYMEEWSHDADNHWHASACDHPSRIKGLAPHSDENNDGICDGCSWNYDHEHTYAEEWSHDADNHWYDVTCSHTIDPKDFGAHADENNDGLCDRCSWNYDHEHEYDTDSWTHDENNHWHAADCGHDVPGIDIAPHADSDNDGICDGCSWNYDHEHTYAKEWSHDADNHWYAVTCTHTIDPKDFGAHADENNDGICDGCSWNYDHEHTYDEEWSHDKDNHWYAVSCGHSVDVKDLAAHADGNNDGICDGCEWNYDHEHTYANEWSRDKDNHWRVVTCGHSVPNGFFAPHADENNDGLCDGCEWNYDHTHTYNTNEWAFDENNHFHAANCGHTVPGIDITAHTDEDADGKCEVCLNQFCDHPFSEDWTFDGKYHWHGVGCSHDIDKIDGKAEHFDNNGDEYCDDCGRSMICEHTYDESEWHSDATHHWYAPTCGHNEDEAKGSYANHTDIDGNLKCDVCEVFYDDPNPTIPDSTDDPIQLPSHVITPKNEEENP